jgi:homoserine kinase
MNSGLKVFAPASVANMAVGYDILGFAINGPGDEIIVRPGKAPGLVIKQITGVKKKLPLEVEKNTAGFAALQLMKHLGEEARPIEMEIHKKMPFGSGLGSSAASAAAGVFAVSEFLNTSLRKRDLVKFAVQGEQVADGAWHADNVAPSLLGGIILIRDNETLDLVKLPAPDGLYACVVYPHISVLTKDSRAVLSDDLSLKQHIAQSGNLAYFIAALYRLDFDMIRRSLTDLIIEPQRASLIPHFYNMKEIALSNDALGFSISGAGPSVFALCENSLIAETIGEKINAFLKNKSIENNVFISKINTTGAFKF